MTKTKEGTTVEVGVHDAAVVIRKDGGLELVIPKPDSGEEEVSAQAYIAGGVAALLSEGNEELMELIQSALERLSSRENTDEDGSKS